jgi:sporulation protein YlmC with PRC-barrel domain
MKKTILTAVSAIAIMAAVPAYANEGTSMTGNDTSAVERSTITDAEAAAQQRDDAVLTKQEAKQGWEDTKEAVSDAANDVSAAAEDMYEDVRAAFVEDENAENANVKVNMRRAVSNVIGSTVYNTNGEAVAKVHDIILDKDGNASMVVLADGEIFGMGKQVAFDYNMIAGQTAEGDLIAPLSEKTISEAAEFSYEMDADNNEVRVMPADAYSVNKLMDAKIVNPENRELAEIEDIVFTDGAAKSMIVSFDKTMGVGGHRAMLNMSDVQLMKNADSGEYSFHMDAAKSAQFESYKKQF